MSESKTKEIKEDKPKCFDELTKKEQEEIMKKSTEVNRIKIDEDDIDVQIEYFKRLPLPRSEKVRILNKLGYKY
jgi:hypothetical protein